MPDLPDVAFLAAASSFAQSIHREIDLEFLFVLVTKPLLKRLRSDAPGRRDTLFGLIASFADQHDDQPVIVAKISPNVLACCVFIHWTSFTFGAVNMPTKTWGRNSPIGSAEPVAIARGIGISPRLLL